MAVVAGDHRQAGQAAFGGFGLQHQRQAAAQAQGESVEKGHGSFLEFAGQAVERFQHPFVEAPGVLEDVGVQQHAALQASEAELADTEQQVSLEVWNNYQSLSVETRSLARTRELVEQSRQSLEVVQGRYRSGVGSMIELLNALTAYASAEDQHIRPPPRVP